MFIYFTIVAARTMTLVVTFFSVLQPFKSPIISTTQKRIAIKLICFIWKLQNYQRIAPLVAYGGTSICCIAKSITSITPTHSTTHLNKGQTTTDSLKLINKHWKLLKRTEKHQYHFSQSSQCNLCMRICGAYGKIDVERFSTFQQFSILVSHFQHVSIFLNLKVSNITQLFYW